MPLGAIIFCPQGLQIAEVKAFLNIRFSPEIKGSAWNYVVNMPETVIIP